MPNVGSIGRDVFDSIRFESQDNPILEFRFDSILNEYREADKIGMPNPNGNKSMLAHIHTLPHGG